MSLFIPNLEILPDAQRDLWPRLRDTPTQFVLYGGTALALRLGHRQSFDFDFFSSEPFDTAALAENVPYLKQAQVFQEETNTLSAYLEAGRGRVQVSFFGGLDLGEVMRPGFFSPKKWRYWQRELGGDPETPLPRRFAFSKDWWLDGIQTNGRTPSRSR